MGQTLRTNITAELCKFRLQVWRSQHSNQYITVYYQWCFKKKFRIRLEMWFYNALLCRQPAACLPWAAGLRSALFDLCQTNGAQLPLLGRFQLFGSGPNAFPPQTAGAGPLQGSSREHGAGQRFKMSLVLVSFVVLSVYFKQLKWHLCFIIRLQIRSCFSTRLLWFTCSWHSKSCCWSVAWVLPWVSMKYSFSWFYSPSVNIG